MILFTNLSISVLSSIGSVRAGHDYSQDPNALVSTEKSSARSDYFQDTSAYTEPGHAAPTIYSTEATAHTQGASVPFSDVQFDIFDDALPDASGNYTQPQYTAEQEAGAVPHGLGAHAPAHGWEHEGAAPVTGAQGNWPSQEGTGAPATQSAPVQTSYATASQSHAPTQQPEHVVVQPQLTGALGGESHQKTAEQAASGKEASQTAAEDTPAVMKSISELLKEHPERDLFSFEDAAFFDRIACNPFDPKSSAALLLVSGKETAQKPASAQKTKRQQTGANFGGASPKKRPRTAATKTSATVEYFTIPDQKEAPAGTAASSHSYPAQQLPQFGAQPEQPMYTQQPPQQPSTQPMYGQQQPLMSQAAYGGWQQPAAPQQPSYGHQPVLQQQYGYSQQFNAPQGFYYSQQPPAMHQPYPQSYQQPLASQQGYVFEQQQPFVAQPAPSQEQPAPSQEQHAYSQEQDPSTAQQAYGQSQPQFHSQQSSEWQPHNEPLQSTEPYTSQDTSSEVEGIIPMINEIAETVVSEDGAVYIPNRIVDYRSMWVMCASLNAGNPEDSNNPTFTNDPNNRYNADVFFQDADTLKKCVEDRHTVIYNEWKQKILTAQSEQQPVDPRDSQEQAAAKMRYNIVLLALQDKPAQAIEICHASPGVLLTTTTQLLLLTHVFKSGRMHALLPTLELLLMSNYPQAATDKQELDHILNMDIEIATYPNIFIRAMFSLFFAHPEHASSIFENILSEVTVEKALPESVYLRIAYWLLIATWSQFCGPYMANYSAYQSAVLNWLQNPAWHSCMPYSCWYLLASSCFFSQPAPYNGTVYTMEMLFDNFTPPQYRRSSG